MTDNIKTIPLYQDVFMNWKTTYHENEVFPHYKKVGEPHKHNVAQEETETKNRLCTSS
jgi:hypothetical protein